MAESADGENMFGCWIETNDGANVCSDLDWINKWWIKLIVSALVVHLIAFTVWHATHVSNDINVIKTFSVSRKEHNL